MRRGSPPLCFPCLVLAMACVTPTTPAGTDPTSPSDPTTSEPTSTAPTSPIDTASTVDPDSFTFSIDGAWEGTALTLTLLRNPGIVTGLLEPGTVREGWPVDGPSVTVDVPDPDPNALQPVPEFPEVGWVVYVAALHLDPDRDARPDPDEVYVGVSQAYLAWIEAPEGVPEALARLGLVSGWNGLRHHGTAWPHVVPRDEMTISVPEPQPTLTLAGAWDLAEPAAPPGNDGRDTGGGGTTPEEPGPLRLAVVPEISLQGGRLPATLLHDAPRSHPWSITLDGAPPQDHGAGGGDDRDPLRGTLPASVVEVPLAYTDDDEDEAFSGADDVVHDVCDPAAGARVTVQWRERSADLAATFAAEGQHGWLAHVRGATSEIRTGHVSDLAVGVGCTPVDDRDPGDGRP